MPKSEIVFKGTLLIPDNLNLNNIYSDEKTPVDVVIEEQMFDRGFKFKATIRNPKYPKAEPIVLKIEKKREKL